MPVAIRRTRDGWLDLAAVTVSATCMLHCLALPLLIAASPALARWLDLGEGVHLWLLLFAVPTSAVALVIGWRRAAARLPLPLGAGGIALMIAGLLAGDAAGETVLTVAGSLALALAHILNWRHRRGA